MYTPVCKHCASGENCAKHNTMTWRELEPGPFLRGHPRKQVDYLVTRLLFIKFAHLKVVDLNFNVFLFLGLS